MADANEKLDPRNHVRLLLDIGEDLPRKLQDRIVGLGTAAVPALVEILGDESLRLDEAPGDGWAPVHALELLRELGAVEAIEPMLGLLADTDPLDMLHDRSILALSELGAPVLEPALRAHEENADEEFRSSVCAVLASLGIRDERVFELLVEQLPDDEVMGAANLAAYGDPRGLPLLSQAFDDMEVEPPETPLANQALFEVRDALEELGGTLTPAQTAKVARALEARRRSLELHKEIGVEEIMGSLIAEEHVGRNDPCPCGSGKKYKKCCLNRDDD